MANEATKGGVSFVEQVVEVSLDVTDEAKFDEAGFEEAGLDERKPEEAGWLINDPIAVQKGTLARRAIVDIAQPEQYNNPRYYLLVEFTPPQLLANATQIEPLCSQQQHWTSHISQQCSRLSGWKEANSLYRHLAISRS